MLVWVPSLCIFLAALITALIATPLASFIAVKLRAIDYPSARRMNKKPIPRMGGIAIFLAFCVAALMHLLGTYYFHWPSVFIDSGTMSVNYYVLALAFAVIFFVGFIDDIFSLKPLPKLIGQIIAASIAAASGLVISNVMSPAGGEIAFGVLSYPITVVYLVAFANIINLLDGLDGLTSGVTCISSLTMFILAFNANRLDAALVAIVLVGATLGFLRYNFHPALIFLGDSGSLLLGFALGSISLLSVTRVAGITTIMLPLVLAGIPIMDTFMAIVRRRRGHVSVGSADRGHIHHRLLQQGFNQRQAVVLIYIWTAVLCASALMMSLVPVMPRIAIFVSLLVFSALFVYKLKLYEPVLKHRQKHLTPQEKIHDRQGRVVRGHHSARRS